LKHNALGDFMRFGQRSDRSVVLVSFGDAAATSRVIAAIQANRTCWCGGAIWQGQTAMRISVSSWTTTDEDVECSLAAMPRITAKCPAS
jgi:hypothetical protein